VRDYVVHTIDARAALLRVIVASEYASNVYEEPMADSSIVTLRLPKSLLSRADSLIPRLRDNSDIFVVGRLSRSVVLRLAVLRGLEAMEESQPRAKTAAPAKKKKK
jgi:hypothetical protein